MDEIRKTSVAASAGKRLAWVPRRSRLAMLGTALGAGLCIALAAFAAVSLIEPPAPAPVIPIGAPTASPAPAILPATVRLTLSGMSRRLAQLGAENRSLREEIKHLATERDELRRQLEAERTEPIQVLEAGEPPPEPVTPPAAAPAAAEPAQPPAIAPAAGPAPAPEALPPAPNSLQAGAAAYRRGEFARAYAVWRPLAEQGIARAQFHLAALYLEGRIGPVDLAAARLWAERARAGGEKLADGLLATIEARLAAAASP